MSIALYPYQADAIRHLKTGSILCGGVGSGKSRTALAYYYISQGYSLDNPKKPKNSKPLYIITTARKRDTLEWEKELVPFLIQSKDVVIDSWNNIKKYKDVHSSFFIFDEDRVTGSGVWVKSFLNIARKNDWIILSATPGDTWSDYIPVFVANGFFKNRTEFLREHAVYNRFSKFPKIDYYIHTGKLTHLCKQILVNMDYKKKTNSINIDVLVDYDSITYKALFKQRWDPYKNKPIENAGELCYTLRKIVNSDPDRLKETKRIVREKKRVIIFYNFDYELEAIKTIDFGKEFSVAEWNGHKHELIPKTECWAYLVQYAAGSEGWNCILTDTILFYSQNYSYKTMVQASGRIDRLNTPYSELYFYHLKSRSSIDLAISKALREKRKFNEDKFVNGK